MSRKRWTRVIGLAVLVCLVVVLGLAGYRLWRAPALSLDQTFAIPPEITDFDALACPRQWRCQSPSDLRQPGSDAARREPCAGSWQAFLGRWEGYGYGAPVKKDHKVVLFVQDITAREGTTYVWWGTNLQYPDGFGEVHFRVVPGNQPSIEWQLVQPDGSKDVATFTYDSTTNKLIGWRKLSRDNSTDGPYELTRDQSFDIYKDYAQYLESKRIYARTYQDKSLQQYGPGYLVYLPEGYEADSTKTWPLVFFLHGVGDRGDNLLLVAKNSPFMYVREKGPLPCIIVAPSAQRLAGLFQLS